MNSKKILVVILLITTVIIGIIAIFLIASLTSTPQDIDDNIPTITVAPSITATPAEAASCGKSCTNNACEEGNTCLVVGGFKRCVANACLDEQGIPLINTGCGSNYCTSDETTPTTTVVVTPTPTSAAEINLDVVKRAIYQCSSQSANRVVQIELAITNETDAPEQLNILDNLITSFSTDLVLTDSISNNGLINAGKIEWQKITVPAGATIKLVYKVNLPEEANGKTFSNTITITNSEMAKYEQATTYIIEFLPCTDLESDQIAMIFGGLVLLVIGIMFFKFQWNQKIGNYFWSHGLEKSYSEAKSFTEIMSDKVTTLKLTISLFSEGMTKRIKTWRNNNKLSDTEKFEQKLVKSDKDE